MEEKMIDLKNFVNSRAYEWEYLINFINNKEEITNKTPMQKFPKHIRRRAMSHYRIRIPLSKRKLQDKLTKKANKIEKRKKYAPRKKLRSIIFKTNKNLNLFIKNNENRIKNNLPKFLETHKFFSKRMKMTDYLGYKIPLSRYEKIFKVSIRFYNLFSCLYEKSFYKVYLINKIEFEFLKINNNYKLKDEEVYFDVLKLHEDKILIIFDPIFEKKLKKIIKNYNDLSDFICIFEILGFKSLKIVPQLIRFFNKEINENFDILEKYSDPKSFKSDLLFSFKLNYHNKRILIKNENYDDKNMKIEKNYSLKDFIDFNNFNKNFNSSLFFENIDNSKKGNLSNEYEIFIKNQSTSNVSKIFMIIPFGFSNKILNYLNTIKVLPLGLREYDFLNYQILNFDLKLLYGNKLFDYYNNKDKEFKKYLRKPYLKKVDYLKKNFKYPFRLYPSKIIKHNNIINITIKSLNKKIPKKYSLIYNPENSVNLLLDKYIDKNFYINKILNHKKIDIKENENKECLNYKFNEKEILEKLENIKNIYNEIGQISYGNFNFEIKKGLGIGFIDNNIYINLLNNQNDIKKLINKNLINKILNDEIIALFRNRNSLNYYFGIIKPI